MSVCVRVCVLSPVCVSVIPWAVAHQTPLSMPFPKQEYWSGLPCPPLGDLADSGIKPVSLAPPALAGRFFTITPPGKPLSNRGMKHQKEQIPFIMSKL